MGKSNRQSIYQRTAHAASSRGVGIKKEIEMRPDGKTVVAVSFDLSTAPVPDRKYLADVASVVFTERSIKMLFGQHKLSGDLRSLLVIDISPISALKYLDAVDRMISPNFTEIASLNKLDIPILEVFKNEPDQTVAFKGNMISGSASGHDACLDFYYISPVAMSLLVNNEKIDIDAVVRVDLHINLMVALIDEIRKVAKKYPQVEDFI